MSMTNKEIDEAADEAMKVFKAVNSRMERTGISFWKSDAQQASAVLANGILSRRLEITRSIEKNKT